MTRLHRRFCVNEAEVVARVIDGEAILINLVNGIYYGMDRTGTMIWSLIDAGHTPDEAALLIGNHFGISKEQVSEHTQEILDQLLAERLVLENLQLTAPQKNVAFEPVNGHAYAPPKLSKFTDMGEILALDPPLPPVKEEPWSHVASQVQHG